MILALIILPSPSNFSYQVHLKSEPKKLTCCKWICNKVVGPWSGHFNFIYQTGTCLQMYWSHVSGYLGCWEKEWSSEHSGQYYLSWLCLSFWKIVLCPDNVPWVWHSFYRLMPSNVFQENGRKRWKKENWRLLYLYHGRTLWNLFLSLKIICH